MDKLFAENGFPGLHISDVSIEVVLRELCETSKGLEELITKYDLDISQKIIRKVYCHLHQKEMEPFGFKMIPFKQKRNQGITTDEMKNFNEIYYGKPTTKQVSKTWYSFSREAFCIETACT